MPLELYGLYCLRPRAQSIEAVQLSGAHYNYNIAILQSAALYRAVPFEVANTLVTIIVLYKFTRNAHGDIGPSESNVALSPGYTSPVWSK